MNRLLKIGTVRKQKQAVECDRSPSTSQNTSISLLQDCAKTQSPLIQKAKKRKYCDEYIKYGFSFIGDEGCPKPQGVVYGEVSSNGSIKSSLLLQHLQTQNT
jgi:hypothetical protein